MKMIRILSFASIATLLFSCAGPEDEIGTITLAGQELGLTYDSYGWIHTIADVNNEVAYISTFVDDTAEEKEIVRIQLGTHSYLESSDEEFQGFMTKGTKEFDNEDEDVDGFSVTYINLELGEIYRSELGSQGESTVDFTTFAYAGGNQGLTYFTVVFKCKVYNVANPTLSKEMTGNITGEFHRRP